MGGRGSSSGVSAEGSAGGGYTHQIGYGKDAYTMTTKYKGTTEEVKRADQITSAVLQQVVKKSSPVVGAVGDVWKGTGYYSNDPKAKEWAKEITKEGFPKTEQGARAFFVSKSSALQFIKNAKTAKEVIDKYGAKVPESTQVVAFKEKKRRK